MTARVCIVEGNEMLVRMYRAIFSAMDCDVVHARTKEETLRLLDREKPGLFVIDERTEDGSGIDTMRAIRAQYAFATTPIIATVSAHPARTDDELK